MTMSLPFITITIIIAFVAIFILNHEGKRVHRKVGFMHSIGIAVFAFFCARASFYLAYKYSAVYLPHPGFQAAMLLIILTVSLYTIIIIFRRIIGIPSDFQCKENEADISICFGGDIKNDQALAMSIQSQLESSAPASVNLFDIHEFERKQDEYQSADAAGVFVYVISESFIEDSSIREKLVQTAQKSGIPGYMYFFLLRGISYQKIKESFPEMEELGNRVMIGTESDLLSLIDDVLTCARNRPEMMRRLRRFVRIKYWLSLVGLNAGILLPLLYITAPVVWFLLALSVYDPNFKLRIPNSILAVAVCQFIALLLYRQRAFDFWPFLGYCLNWRMDSRSDLQQSPWLRTVLGFWSWAELPYVRRRSDISHSRCLDPEDFDRALQAWSGTVLGARLYFGAVLLGGGVTSFLFGCQISHAIKWALLGGIIGFILPVWVSWSQQFVKHRGYWTLGLTDKELNRTSRFFRLEILSGRFIGNISFLSHKMFRSWFCKKPRVFISYSWRADEKRQIAPELHRVLSQIGVDHFYDKDFIRSPFASWRASVSDALMQCTHVLLVLDENMPTEQVVDREFRTAVQRLHTEILPAFICVADSQTIQSLLEKEDVPFELRWLLECAPSISPSEAIDPSIIESVIRQRTRQGRLKDLFALFFPSSYLKSFLAESHVMISDDKSSSI